MPTRSGTGWTEVFLGGSPAAEARLFDAFTRQIREVQAQIKAQERAPAIRRAFHAKIHAGMTNAEFRIPSNVPEDLRLGLFQPGATYPATVRFSNASGAIRPDSKRDLRGVAVRVTTGDGTAHDFLMTNAAASHARDARQFMVAATAMASSRKIMVAPKLLWGLGIRDAVRMMAIVLRSSRKIDSLATERYWSRAPIAFGPLAVKFMLQPAPPAPAGCLAPGGASTDDYLREDLVERLRQGPVTFDFRVQRYVDGARTPIEDGTIEWQEADAPPESVAQLVIPQQDLRTAGAQAAEAVVDGLEFNPWNTTDEFRPLGSLNRARKPVYAASADYRAGRQGHMEGMQVNQGTQPPPGTPGMQSADGRHGLQTTGGTQGLQAIPGMPGMQALKGAPRAVGATLGRASSRLFEGGFLFLNRFVPWHKLPAWLGIFNLLVYRNVLRRENLYDTYGPTSQAPPAVEVPPYDPHFLHTRNSEGAYNDLQHPEMGSTGRRFGRNVPLQYAVPDPEPALLTPSPREISRRLLKRDSFIPATTLNLLAAAWIQFQTHDWFAHGKIEGPEGDAFQIPLSSGDDWETNPMRIRRTPPDPTRTPAEAHLPPTYVNRGSHWWDGSQIYGSDEATTSALRAGKDGRLAIDETNHFLPVDPQTGIPRTGFSDNWWVGLNLLHTLFAREHNAICDRLRREHPYWSDEQIFDTARLVNTALMAKIHTVDWTPGILSHPSLRIGMRANWWGLQMETLHRLFGRLSASEAISGIPGSPVDHHGVPYALTEEFASVYRLHPLIPDEVAFWSVSTGAPTKRLSFPEVAFEHAQKVFDANTSMADALYSFGISHPGAITLHNFPNFLRDLRLPDGQHLDLAAVDIMRDRERGVPRYNTFRRLLHRGPVRSFDEITSNPVWARELREVYEGDINRVDLMVGMFAEDLPAGFGFSDTAFRIFILMATRRLKSDRFFTTDYTPEVYTPGGLDWIESNNMTTVLLRHHPELAPALRHVGNAFAPWRRVEKY